MIEAKDIVAHEVARQAEFGMEPSWEDFVIAGQQAGIREVAPTFEALFKIAINGDYANGNEAFGTDEGRMRAGEALDAIEKWWQAKLKEWGVRNDR